ncbi:putative Ankyrin repeat-containing protein [Melia azedarach]|uniref:Ankyrin repeat-containing protein n=1 Tax=Melia azedarach TaxID=155640 RepID=A0ACC1Z196_MELAZ|nr:putative Ankyrin repeat-containing protein [Melia azedarach]
MHAMPQLTVPGRSRSSSFSKSSIASSPNSLDKQKGIFIDNEVAGPSCANQLFDDETPNNTVQKQGSKRMKSQYFCFGGSSLSVKTPVSRQRQNQNCQSFHYLNGLIDMMDEEKNI